MTSGVLLMLERNPFELLLGVKPDSASLFEPLVGWADAKLAGAILTGVKPEFTGANPLVAGVNDFIGVASVISVSDLSGVPIDAVSAEEALAAGESGPKLLSGEFAVLSSGVLFIGEPAGDGLMGPPKAASISCCTPGFADLTHSSYG